MPASMATSSRRRPGGAAAGPVGEADLGRADRLAAAAQEVGELVTLHDPMLPAAGAAIQGAALPR